MIPDTSLMMARRDFLLWGTGAVAAGVLPAPLAALAGGSELPPMTIYKSESCLCCAKWVDHVKAAGFKTTVYDRDPIDPVKDELKVPRHVRSCHTALAGGYLVEGHVPAGAIRRLLAERPQAAGLAVPGMPIGSPGMEGGAPETYEVVLFGQ